MASLRREFCVAIPKILCPYKGILLREFEDFLERRNYVTWWTIGEESDRPDRLHAELSRYDGFHDVIYQACKVKKL